MYVNGHIKVIPWGGIAMLKEYEKIVVRVQALSEICASLESNLTWLRDAVQKYEEHTETDEDVPEWEQREYLQNRKKIAAYESAFSTIMQSMKK